MNTLYFSIILLFIDIIWISLVMKQLYKNVFTIKMNYLSAIIAYCVILLSYHFFVKGNLKNAALIGLCIWGTYGFTLSAIYDKYPVSLAIKETLWGMTVMTFSTWLTNQFVK